ncbi:MAG TPA: trypsin-like peptidase domain-containing protein [Streptosporangiaceae bacterium]|nr:trypsin-like peptidase domain-containing protein [Streptosporangiaceae bacterium]
MTSQRELEEILARAVCQVTVGNRARTGTGWLLTGDGIVLTAGHLIADDISLPVSVSFPDVARARPAKVRQAAHEPNRGIDFAVLECEVPEGVPAVPISLERAPHGSLMAMGYGLTLRSISAASGEFVGPYDPQNSSANRLFRCRSIELAEEGYSGCPIASSRSGAVVALQIEAVTGGRGARDTVLAMPLYRVAEFWKRLEEVEARQAETRDGYLARRVLVVTAASAGVLRGSVQAIHAALARAGFDVLPLDSRSRIVSELGDAWAVVLIGPELAADPDQARDVVVSAILRQVPVVVVASSAAGLAPYLRGLPVVSGQPDSAAERVAEAVLSLSEDKIRLASLSALSDSLEEIQARSADPIRFQPHIDELRSLIGGWPTRVERQDRRITAGTQTLQARSQEPASLVPSAGVRPIDPEHLFRDRTAEAERVSSYLADGTVGIVGIVGRAGMGKTALAAHVMAALRRQRWMHATAGPRIDGLVYLSTRTSSGITSAEVVLKLSRLAGAPGIVRSWTARTTPIAQRIAQVIEAAGDRQIVVLLDNFEDLLDETGHICGGDELAELLSGLIAAETGLKFLITSRERVEFDASAIGRTRVVELRSGLPEDESIRMLRELDPQGEYGLAQAPLAALRPLVAMVHGIPRALQLVVGLLANDPMLDVSDLTDSRINLVDESLNGIIMQTHARLDEPARWVLLALAVLGRPESLNALDFVLRPFAPGTDVPAIVRRLIRTQIVSVDKLTRHMALHPADRAYLLSQAAEQRAATLALIRRRSAEYYLSLAPDLAGIKDIEGARPLLFAVEHLLACQDFAAGLEVLDQLDELLEFWGYYQLVIDLRVALAGGVGGESWIANAMRLGRLYWLTGDAAASALWLTRAEEAALAYPDQLGPILVDLAASQRDSGHLRQSLPAFIRAFRVAAATGADPLVISRGLIQVTHTVRSLGFLDTALACTGRAQELASARAAGAQASRARFLRAAAQLNGAISDRLAGDLASARRRLDDAMELAEGIGDRGLIAYVRCGLANLERTAGAPARGVAELLAAMEIYEEIGDRWGQAACLATLCWAHADLLDAGSVARYAEQGHLVARGCNPRALASVMLAESVMARRAGDYATSISLGTASATLLRESAFDLYGAWAECELQATRFLAGQQGDRWVMPYGATRITRAVWLGLRAASVACGPAGPARDSGSACVEAAAGASRLVPAGSPRVVALTVLDGLLVAVATCLASDDAQHGAILAPLMLAEAAPGIVADYRVALDRLCAAELAGSAGLRLLVARG